MRVLHFARVINRSDFIDNVIRHTDAAKFRMLACTLTAESNIEPPGYADDRIPHWLLGGQGRYQYPATVVRLAQLLRRERVQLLHTHHYDEALIGVLAGRLAGTRVVIGRHYHDELYLSASGGKLRALLAVEAFCNRLACQIIVPSTTIRKLLVGRQGVAAAKVRVVPYGFDFGSQRYRPGSGQEVEEARQALGLERSFVVGNFGRHHPLKGQQDLLQAFPEVLKHVPDARLLMVGEGPSTGSLRRLCDRLGLADRVVFAGWRTDVTRLLSAVDVVVHPTLHEAFPQLMVEAMALERPLVITDVSGATEIVEDGRNGLLVQRRDPSAIAQAICWVAEHGQEARQLGKLASQYVREHLSLPRVIPQYEACYAEALRPERSEDLVGDSRS